MSVNLSIHTHILFGIHFYLNWTAISISCLNRIPSRMPSQPTDLKMKPPSFRVDWDAILIGMIFHFKQGWMWELLCYCHGLKPNSLILNPQRCLQSYNIWNNKRASWHSANTFFHLGVITSNSHLWEDTVELPSYIISWQLCIFRNKQMANFILLMNSDLDNSRSLPKETRVFTNQFLHYYEINSPLKLIAQQGKILSALSKWCLYFLCWWKNSQKGWPPHSTLGLPKL